jgi:hypothetical protein
MRALGAASLLVIVALACGRSETSAPAPGATPPGVSAPAPAGQPGGVRGIELGTALGADGRVTAPAASFAPGDTIYVSVLTEGQPAGATLSARWTYEDGQVVSEGRETLATPGRAATEFHIAKPDGWPAGRYRVEIALNGEPAGARDFEVR